MYVKKNELKPWLKTCWVIPPKEDKEFVYRMEDILDVYARPHDPKRPLVCMDESFKQLIGETRISIPIEPGQPERYDYEYTRNGVKHLFMIYAPLEGKRHVAVTDNHTKGVWARRIKQLVDVLFPHAEKIVLVEDNLNTHNPAVLYEVFPPQEAKRLLDKIEFHFTPKHGSWLDMAEIEFSILMRQCLDRRIADEEMLKREIAAWENQRNNVKQKTDWRFTTKDARIKLKKLYPSVING